MEIIADPTNPDPSRRLPYTEAQKKALVEFSRRPGYRDLPFYGHGEIQASKQRTEGLEMAEAVRADRANRATSPSARSPLVDVIGHHPATVGLYPKPVVIEDHSGGMMAIIPPS